MALEALQDIYAESVQWERQLLQVEQQLNEIEEGVQLKEDTLSEMDGQLAAIEDRQARFDRLIGLFETKYNWL
jgi:septal ring factor EnvC (AmiA/AmiB activator)